MRRRFRRRTRRSTLRRFRTALRQLRIPIITCRSLRSALVRRFSTEKQCKALKSENLSALRSETRALGLRTKTGCNKAEKASESDYSPRRAAAAFSEMIFHASASIVSFLYNSRISASVISRSTLHGFPTATTLSGISFVTTLPAPMTA